MAYPFHTTVTLKGFHQEYFHLTMNLSGLDAETNSANVVGKAVTVDATRPNTAKLAGDGDTIIGRVASFENRKNEGTVVGAIEFRFSHVLPVASAAYAALKVGDTVVGAGGGEVKAAATADLTKNFVAEKYQEGGKSYAVVCKF